MKDSIELDVLSNLSQGTTTSNPCIDMLFGWNVDNLSCMNYISYFSYHRPILQNWFKQEVKYYKIHKLINSIWNKEELPDQWKESYYCTSW
jgi:hypothetical protein